MLEYDVISLYFVVARDAPLKTTVANTLISRCGGYDTWYDTMCGVVIFAHRTRSTTLPTT